MSDTAPAIKRPEHRRTIRTTIVGLGIAFAGTAAWLAISAVLRASDVVDTRNARQVLGLTWAWVVTIALVFFVLRIERRPLTSIGVRGTRWTAYALLPLWWLLNIAVTVLIALLFLRNVDTSAAREILSLPLWTKIAIVITAAVTEEVLFRGYPIERLSEVTGRTWLAGAITALVFVAFHIPSYGLLPGLARTTGSIVLTIVYIRRRSLGPVIALHALFDVPIVFLS